MSPRRKDGPPCFVCIDKPAGLTSFDVVRRVRRASQYSKVGHGGTLDPFATGLLVLGLGAATRLLRHLLEGSKRYRARIRFGSSTDTDDATGQVLTTGDVAFDEAELRQAMGRFQGEILQVPPRVSAIKVDGERAYTSHQQGRPAPELTARPVRVDRFELQVFDGEAADVVLDCGGGTYVRSLARDLGEALGCPAHVETLRREASGPLTLEQAIPLKQFADEWFESRRGVLSPLEALADWPRFVLSEDDAVEVRHGGQPDPEWFESDDGSLPEHGLLLDSQDRLVAAVERKETRMRLSLVIPETAYGDLSRPR